MRLGPENAYGYIKSCVVKILVDQIKAQSAHHFLAETSDIYRGIRGNPVDHLDLACPQGFDYSQMGVPRRILKRWS